MATRHPNRTRFPILDKPVFNEWIEMPYWDGVRHYASSIEVREDMPDKALEAVKKGVERSLTDIIIKNLPCVVGSIEFDIVEYPGLVSPVLTAGIRITPLGVSNGS